MDDGFIKFDCNWIRTGAVPGKEIVNINRWRDRLYDLGFIGSDPSGIGFGNISIRRQNGTFLITGAATGKLERLDAGHYVLVTEYNFRDNCITCTGPIKASSESLTHASIYECSPLTNAVIHIHNKSMWERLIDKVPTTGRHVLYGTPEMAGEIKKLFEETDVSLEKILVMGGHPEGIISFGSTPDEAAKILLDKFPGNGKSSFTIRIPTE
jgi:L-ribulose-5-phosphate 4-epimerase